MLLYIDSEHYFDTEKGVDISIPLSDKGKTVSAWYCDPIKITPVKTEHFIGDVNQGGSVNFRNIFLNPHGNGTHTECVGHISKENFTLNQCLKEFHFFGDVISLAPTEYFNVEFNQKDYVIDAEILRTAIEKVTAKEDNFQFSKVIAIRTLPNSLSKLTNNYSNSNPTYLLPETIELIKEKGYDHLILDLPSVDREMDHGNLTGHHLFWEYPNNTQKHRTITELAFIPDNLLDGKYIFNIQITSLESDASPSKIVVYEILKHSATN